MTRRHLLQGLVMSLWSKAAGAEHQLTGSLSATGVALANEPASERSALSPAEMESLLALGEVLVQGRALSHDEKGDLTEHIEYWSREIPGQLDYYRTAVRLLDRLAGKPFSSLEYSDRIRLLNRHRLGPRAIPISQDPEPIAVEARAVRSRVVPALIEGYWSSPAGWQAIGYEVFPGRCGDLTRYTRPEP